MENIDKGFQNFQEIFKAKKTIKPPAYPWQQFALDIISQLDVPKTKRNSVFLICKKYPRVYIEKCLNETKELCQSGEPWKYFFKVIEAGKTVKK